MAANPVENVSEPTMVAFYTDAGIPLRVGAYHPGTRKFKVFEEDQAKFVGWREFTEPARTAKAGRFLLGPFLTGNQYEVDLGGKKDYVALFPRYPKASGNKKLADPSQVDAREHDNYLLVTTAQFTAKGWDMRAYNTSSLIECPTDELGEVKKKHTCAFDDLLKGKFLLTASH